MQPPHGLPVGTWGRVISSAEDPTVLKVRIDETSGGGFLIITAEARGVFDTWVELESDVEAYLSTMEVAWEANASASPAPGDSDRNVLHALGYDECWLTYGVLDLTYLLEQAAEWNRPDADKSTEHYRAAAWVHYVDGLESISTPQLLRVLELARSAFDSLLDGHVHHLLIRQSFLTDAQFDLVSEDLQNEGFTRVVKRLRLLRRLSREATPSDDLLTLCVSEGDGAVHDALLGRADLPSNYVEWLAAKGANKRIRHVAKQRLRKGAQGPG